MEQNNCLLENFLAKVRKHTINIFRAGHAHCAREVISATMVPAAGTHRSDSFRLDAGVGAVSPPDFRRGRMSIGIGGKTT